MLPTVHHNKSCDIFGFHIFDGVPIMWHLFASQVELLDNGACMSSADLLVAILLDHFSFLLQSCHAGHL